MIRPGPSVYQDHFGNYHIDPHQSSQSKKLIIKIDHINIVHGDIMSIIV